MAELTREEVLVSIKTAAERMGLELEDLQEMIEDVLTDCSEKSKRLSAAAAEKRSEDIRKIAHDIKGSTANYGLQTASQLALQIEKGCQNLPPGLIEELQVHLTRLSALRLGSSA